MATAIDTLCSQAYGAKQYGAVGTTFARGTVLTAVTTFPIVGTLWFYMQDVLVAMGENKIVQRRSDGSIFFQNSYRCRAAIRTQVDG